MNESWRKDDDAKLQFQVKGRMRALIKKGYSEQEAKEKAHKEFYGV